MLRSIRLTIKATCNMNLANFPMDDQLCTVEIESFGYTMADLRYSTPTYPVLCFFDFSLHVILL